MSQALQGFVLLPSLRMVELDWAVEPVWRPALDCLWRSAGKSEAAALGG